MKQGDVLISRYWEIVGNAIVTIPALKDHIKTPKDIINATKFLLVFSGIYVHILFFHFNNKKLQ